MSRKYSRRNYSEALDLVTPEIYREEDLKLATEKQDLPSKILYSDADYVIRFVLLNSYIEQLATLDSFSSLDLGPWNTSDYTDRAYSTYVGYAEGLVKHFIPQNKLTHITPKEFDLEILNPLGYKISDYSTSAAFNTFLSGTLLPKLKSGDGLASPVLTDLAGNTSNAFGSGYSESFVYLVNSLGLFQLLNYSVVTSYYNGLIPRLSTVMTDKLFNKSEPLTLEDAMEALRGFALIDTNANVFGTLVLKDEFKVDESSTYLSGTQSLDKITTWNSILYGLPAEEDDTFTKDFYTSYFEDKSYTIPYVTQGPMKKFMTAMGFLMGDIDNKILSLESLNSILECPDQYLPYLADQIGWKLYTSNTDSWRRQLRDARELLQKKGSKQGLIDLLKSILPATEIDFDNNFSEYFESYVPRLIYYLLKTESAELASLSNWTGAKAEQYAGGEYDPTNLDNNIRFVVDHMLLDAVYDFPELFSVRGYTFRPDHPNFSFNYRGRDFNIPPFEDERFYKDCDLTYDLIEFFKSRLLCLGVKDSICDSFESYILSNTIESDFDSKLYNNGFLFLTKTLQQAPNYDRVISDLESKLYDYLPMWNGKSSQFTLEVSAGSVDDKFFVQTAYTTEDFFESLKGVQDFVPAKTLARVDISLRHTDITDSYTNTYPRVSYAFLDTPNPSGAMASFEVSTLDMRDPVLGLTGSSIDPDYVKDPRSTNDYSALPVFKRDRMGFGRETTNAAWVDTSTVYNVSGPYREVAPRTATRRRDFQKNLSKGQIFRRDGFNPPTFLNVTTKGSAATTSSVGELSSYTEYVPLGLIPSSMKFTAVPDHKNVPEVYDECQTTTSNDVFNGIRSKFTFKVRGDKNNYSPPIDSSIMNNLVFKYRDNLEDIYKLIFRMKDEDLDLQAKLTVDNNLNIATNIDWLNEYESLKNKLWNDTDYSLEEDFEKIKMDLYKRVPNEFNKTFNYLYLNDYLKQGGGVISNASLDDVKNGGSSLVSHIYGPTFFNAFNSLDGSSMGAVYNSVLEDNPTVFDRSSVIINKKIQSVDQDFEFPMRACDTTLSANYLNVGIAPEEFSQHYISGVEIITWKSSNDNKMFVYNLSSDEGFLSENATLLDGNLLGIKAKEFLPRLRYTFNYKEAGDNDNYLRPDHNFSVELSSLFLNEKTFKTSARTAAIWIHTEEETDFHGRKVFWNYMPNGKWEMIDSSAVGASNGIDYVRNTLSHKFAHPTMDISETATEACYVDNVNREVLYSLTNEDFVVNRVEMNTVNRHIKVPLSYYQYRSQVHRKDQKYVVEVFPTLSQEDTDFWAFKGISCKDETMRHRASTRKTFEIPDFSLSKTESNKKIEMFYPDGSAVPIGTVVYITRDGEVYDGDKHLTISIANKGRRILYETAFIGFVEFASTEQNSTNVVERPYEGYAQISGYTVSDFLNSVYQGQSVAPSVYGKKLGSYIVKSVDVEYLRNPRNLLSIFRFYNDISEELQSRDSSKTENFHGPNGGGRSNYRIHPAEFANTSNFLTTGKITDLRITN
jgi:hypothetical protein